MTEFCPKHTRETHSGWIYEGCCCASTENVNVVDNPLLPVHVAQADLSLRWVHTHFVGFVMSCLICIQNLELLPFVINKRGY